MTREREGPPASSGASSLVEVALPIPLRRTFNYRVPGPVPPPGCRVRVPFRGRVMAGWTVGPGAEVPGLRDVERLLDRESLLSAELWSLAEWVAEYYVAPLGMVLRSIFPVALTRPSGSGAPARGASRVRSRRRIGTLEELDRVFARAPRQREAYERLTQAGGEMPLAALLEAGFSRSVVGGLKGKGIVEVAVGARRRDPLLDHPAATGAEHEPTPAQRRALRPLADSLEGRGGTFLLHGVTGSGKTLVYIRFIGRALERGGGAIVLVPEISLTPQTVGRFRQAFGDKVAVWHSGLSRGERARTWRELRAGAKRVAIGARSAVFAPVGPVGAIVVDEEHDGSYKQGETPRYNARDVAVVRARRAGASCLLGSATPSLESWANAQSGKYTLLSLPERVGGGSLPSVRVVDLRGVAASRRARGDASGRPSRAPPHVLSPPLARAMESRLERSEQTILLLNRRGYATFALCESCGGVSECVGCSVAMTLHRARRMLVCHHCGRTREPPARCPHCGAPDVSYRGLGTEQVERVVVEAFPGARVVRMDVDTTQGRRSHAEILERVRKRRVDVLLGTQIIAKGLDFPRVTLVGVVNADVGLHLPDFRSCERTFQLLSQVAGRAGRGALPGEVVIQTYMPDHYVVRAAVAHDYRGFVARELGARAEPPYPPHRRMARIVLSSPAREDALAAAESLREWLAARPPGGPQVVGPAPAPLERLNSRFRWHLVLRGRAPAIGRALEAVASDYRPSGRDVRVSLDRDPMHLM